MTGFKPTLYMFIILVALVYSISKADAEEVKFVDDPHEWAEDYVRLAEVFTGLGKSRKLRLKIRVTENLELKQFLVNVRIRY